MSMIEDEIDAELDELLDSGGAVMGPHISGAVYTDEAIDCAGCGKPFEWSAGEQAYYAEKGFQPPKRCAACRKERNERKERRKARAERDERIMAVVAEGRK